MDRRDQAFLDYLTGEIERHFDEAGVFIKETWRSQSWIPDEFKPPPPPPPRYEPIFIAPRSLFSSTKRWITDHSALTFAALAFLGTGGFFLYQRRKLYLRKRRAKRRANGQKKEVVVVAGIPNSPVTRSVVVELERRGFIVYVIASSAHEEQLIRDEGKPDIMSLHLNVTDVGCLVSSDFEPD